MMTSQSPFRGQDEDEIYDAILTDEPPYPKHMPNKAVDLIRKLLVRKPEERLGYQKGAEEIMDHEFFNSIDWDALYKKEVMPPYRPAIKHRNDLSNFDTEFTSTAPFLTPVQSGMFTFQLASLKMLKKLSLSLEPGDAGTIQGLSLQLHIKQTNIPFLTTNSIAAVATAF